MLPTSCGKAVAATLFAPFWRNKMLTSACGLVGTLDPCMGVTLCVELVIARRDDAAFAGGHLLVYRSRRRNIDVEIEFCQMSHERGSEPASATAKSVFLTLIATP
jgi:hypothetical protein